MSFTRNKIPGKFVFIFYQKDTQYQDSVYYQFKRKAKNDIKMKKKSELETREIDQRVGIHALQAIALSLSFNTQ